MNQRIRELSEHAGLVYWPNKELDKFAELIIQECFNYLQSEIDRLTEYKNSLEEWDKNRQNDVDICIEKCYSNIFGLKQHFGVK